MIKALMGLVLIIFASVGAKTLFTESIDEFKHVKTRFTNWRKNGCKIKCLCKHEYDVEFANSLFGEIPLKRRKCGKKKIIKNLSGKLVDKLWCGRRDEEQREERK